MGVIEDLKTAADTAATEQAKAEKEAKAAGFVAPDVVAPGDVKGYDLHYCLEARHPGATDLADVARLFAVKKQTKDETDPGAPYCPACQRAVSACAPGHDEEGNLTVPESIQRLSDRLAAVPA